MKHGIFISYSDYDKDKVDLIVKELDGNPTFFPIVIASNREALKPLAQKVATGITDAKIIVPILTENSISTQWINQEIGYAYAQNKKIMPIVESTLIERLKGFIHKQIDLPYNYSPNSIKGKVHKDFISQFRNLLRDLEKEVQLFSNPEPITEKSDFEKSLEHADRMNEELEFQNNKRLFLNSNQGIENAKTEVLEMFSDIEQKVKLLQEKKFNFGIEKDLQRPTFILKCEGFSFSIAWHQQYSNSMNGALLFVRLWKGHLSKDPNTFYFDEEKPQKLSDISYTFDRNKESKICWLNLNDKKQYFSSQIVDTCLNWLIKQVAKKRLQQK